MGIWTKEEKEQQIKVNKEVLPVCLTGKFYSIVHTPKNRKKFVTNKVRRDGKRRVFNDHGSPFVANADNGKHIFYRDGRDKLKRLYGPSLIYALFGADKKLENHAEIVFPNVLQEELEKVLYAK